MPLTTFRTYANVNEDDTIIYGSGWEFFYEATDQRNNGSFCYEEGNSTKENRLRYNDSGNYSVSHNAVDRAYSFINMSWKLNVTTGEFTIIPYDESYPKCSFRNYVAEIGSRVLNNDYFYNALYTSAEWGYMRTATYNTEVVTSDGNTIDDETHDNVQTHIVDYSAAIKSVKVENVSTKDQVKSNCFRGIFKYCANLETVDLTGIDFENCGNFQYAFDSSGIVSIYVDDEGILGIDFESDSYLFSKEKPTPNNVGTINWVTQEEAKADSTKDTFYESYKWVKDGDTVYEIFTDKMPYEYYYYSVGAIFYYPSKLKSVNMGFTTNDTKAAFKSMCQGCTNLEEFSFGNPTDINGKQADNRWMFDECYKLREIDFSGITLDNAKRTKGMFSECLALEEIKGLKLVDAEGSTCEMFENCTSLKSIDLGDSSFANQISSDNMFKNCYNLETVILPQMEIGGTIKNSETSTSVNNANEMFQNCYKLKFVGMKEDYTAGKKGFNGAFLKVESNPDFYRIFYHCNSLDRMDLGTWNIAQDANIKDMITGLDNLSEITTPKLLADYTLLFPTSTTYSNYKWYTEEYVNKSHNLTNPFVEAAVGLETIDKDTSGTFYKGYIVNIYEDSADTTLRRKWFAQFNKEETIGFNFSDFTLES